jgi:hypothetical protein
MVTRHFDMRVKAVVEASCCYIFQDFFLLCRRVAKLAERTSHAYYVVVSLFPNLAGSLSLLYGLIDLCCRHLTFFLPLAHSRVHRAAILPTYGHLCFTVGATLNLLRESVEVLLANLAHVEEISQHLFVGATELFGALFDCFALVHRFLPSLYPKSSRLSKLVNLDLRLGSQPKQS